ncbi:hypothetical protein [Bradyrhizobium sp. 1(2017)]|uniref:hypothetical protein n=1 Tax=Bradyrhizobium sp. 1(2017) TaxID=1404888 RepID=UPI00140EB289|nr:hypothetical protein [Bradyrhizobium sp. 1(2017)]QIO31375.1 hypothetical protein HAP40_05830 [Bradyrhizobium sp. 1(2017)]
MTEFDEILSKALEAVRFYHPRLNAETYAFPKPANSSGTGGLATPSIREMYCRTALLWLDRLSKSGKFDTGAIAIAQLRSRIFCAERIFIPREIILAMAVYRCVEISVAGDDVWLGKLWDGPVPI